MLERVTTTISNKQPHTSDFRGPTSKEHLIKNTRSITACQRRVMIISECCNNFFLTNLYVNLYKELWLCDFMNSRFTRLLIFFFPGRDATISCLISNEFSVQGKYVENCPPTLFIIGRILLIAMAG